ncbi:hypothetical protein [Modestobacter sp. URMC 112]
MSGTLAAVTAVVAPLVTAAALAAGLLTLAVTRRPPLALSVFLDLLVAAGLLRLAGDPGWPAIATAAALVALRRLIGFGLRVGGRSWTSALPSGRGTAGTAVVARLVRPAWHR